jgi:TolA-binding protein
MIRESAIVLLALSAILLVTPRRAEAQVQRQPTSQVAVPPNPQAVDAMVNPLKGRVEQLEQEVRRLEGALESLRLTVNANQKQYAQHSHRIPYFGVTTAKTIYPGTPASDGTLVAIQVPGGLKTTSSGPPE